jgi:hypothetical protein
MTEKQDEAIENFIRGVRTHLYALAERNSYVVASFDATMAAGVITHAAKGTRQQISLNPPKLNGDGGSRQPTPPMIR